MLLGFSATAPAQTWVETHPALTDVSSHAQSTDARARAKSGETLTPYREARLRADDESRPDDRAKADSGSLDHPANASGESSRHE